jgi:hypothetical protein
MSHAHCRPLAAGLTLGLVLLTAACADSPAPTAPTRELDSAPAFAKGSSSGAIIVRRGIVGNWWGGDPRDQLAVVVGWDASIAEVCALPDLLNGPISPGTGKGVITPTGRIHFNADSREAHVVVVQYGGGPVSSPCQLVDALVVATGTVTFTLRINIAAGGVGQVAHVTAEGIVDLTSGGQAHLDATARYVVHPDGSVVFDEERVRLTPL